jgi:hypothetical protein
MEPATVWQFVLHKNGTRKSWTWRRTRPDGFVLEISAGPHAEYGKAINDAIRHGFRPERESWVVTDDHSVFHFPPAHAGPRKNKLPGASVPRLRNGGARRRPVRTRESR